MADPSRAGAFPSTRWSRVLGRPGDVSGARLSDIEHLAQVYWRPVFDYVRARWRLPHDEALDATQDFFATMLESGRFDSADQTRGRFRAFVKTTLQNHLIDRARAAGAEKRGGGRAFVSIDDARAIAAETLEQNDGRSPDEVLDERWRRELIERAVKELETEFDREGRPVYFAVFRDHYLDDSEDLDYRALAERHGISTVDVSNYLRKAKQRYRARVRQIVQETVSDPDELEAELVWLFGSSA